MADLRVFAAVAALLLAAATSLRAQDTTQHAVHIGLTYQPGTRPGVAVLPIAGPAGDSVQAMIARDLDYSDQVEIIGAAGTSAAGAVTQAAQGPINYGQWKTLGALALVQGTMTGAGVHVVLHDVVARKIVDTRDFVLPSGAGTPAWRLAVHGISDEVERWITGTRGIAQTRILYVRGGRLYVIDSDGADDRAITTSGTSLSPAWQRSGRYIAYSAFGPNGTQIIVRDMNTGQVRLVAGRSGGLNITPAFSPDGRSMLYAHGGEHGTDLYMTDAFARTPARPVTVGRGTDNVSPSFSPDGHRITFTSNRDGHPEVYTADADGSNPVLLTSYNFGDQNYRSDPDWSPDGRLIAFESQINGQFQIMTISLQDRSVKQLTSTGRNENPAWAPDSRHLVFTSSRTGTRELFVLDSQTGRARQLTHAAGARLAAWSRPLDHTP